MKSEHFSLYDLMGSDHYLVAAVEDSTHVTTMVIDEADNIVFNESSHVYAWDSLVSFAKMVLDQDKKIQEELNAM